MDKRAYPVLYNLVFGEGIVNDAVAVVLLGTVNNLTARHSALSLSVVLQLLLGFVSLFLSSLLLGVGMGLLSALLVRHIFGKRHDCDREVRPAGSDCCCLLRRLRMRACILRVCSTCQCRVFPFARVA